ncbi:MAG: hypothetical protein WD894_07365 [Pirellulales bacterium]
MSQDQSLQRGAVAVLGLLDQLNIRRFIGDPSPPQTDPDQFDASRHEPDPGIRDGGLVQNEPRLRNTLSGLSPR